MFSFAPPRTILENGQGQCLFNCEHRYSEQHLRRRFDVEETLSRIVRRITPVKRRYRNVAKYAEFHCLQLIAELNLTKELEWLYQPQ
jgi:hypothetical protein